MTEITVKTQLNIPKELDNCLRIAQMNYKLRTKQETILFLLNKATQKERDQRQKLKNAFEGIQDKK